MSTRPARAEPPTIDDLIGRYLTEVGRTRSRRETDEIEGSLDLLRSGLEGYGYQYLTTRELQRWQRASEEADQPGGDRHPFCGLFGARALAKYLDEFLGYFMIRKVLLSPEDTEATVEDVRGFVDWLGRERFLTPAQARKASGRLARASHELPAADRLGQLLYAEAEKRRGIAQAAQYGEIVEDFLVIERVAPGRIWFLDEVGPIEVPEEASRLARPGWTVNLVLGRIGDVWHVLEVGNVYPETLA